MMNKFEAPYVPEDFTYYIGLEDRDKDGQYGWTDGSPVTNVRWDTSKMKSMFIKIVHLPMSGEIHDGWTDGSSGVNVS